MSDIQTQWNFGPLISGTDFPAERARIQAATKAFSEKWRAREDYLHEPAILAEALRELEAWVRLCGPGGGREAYYVWLQSELREDDTDLKGQLAKIEEFGTKMANEMQFFELRLGKIPESDQKKFLSSPELADYRHFLELIFAEARYFLSEGEEKVLNLKAAPAHELWIRMVSSAIAKEEREVLNEDGVRGGKPFADLMMLLDSQKKAVRDDAARAVNEILDLHAGAAEAELNAIVTDKKINDELRGMPRPDLERHLDDDIDPEVVDALMASVESHFDVARRYYALKARLFGVPQLAYHERNVPYGAAEKTYTFEEAYELCHRVFSRLDPSFSGILERLTRNGQLDVYPAKGKHNGAFCAHYSVEHPTYVLLNHGNRLRDVTTLAHEMGHAINNELMRERQNALNFGTPTSTAEVASVFMEDFIIEEVLRGVDDETRLAIQMQRLNDDVSTAFRQAACYRFEEDLHREVRAKGYLSREEIGKLFANRMSAYMGEAVAQSPGSENWWVYWSHIREFFYVYSYASGLLIGKALQAGVRQDAAFIGKVKDFLAAGHSRSPKNIFLELGVNIADPEFWTTGIGEIERLLESTEELARKLGKLPA